MAMTQSPLSNSIDTNSIDTSEHAAKPPRRLITRSGAIRLPAYVPITTFGDKYPLDKLIQPYLPRLADTVMVSFHYARQMEKKPRLPLMVDSGGFVSLFKGSRVRMVNGLGVVEIQREEGLENLSPLAVLDLQEQVAEVAFTLDFPIPPGTDPREAKKRQALTITNALWALNNRRRRDLPLYACVQGWDIASFRDCARCYAEHPFEGIAIGGLVPRTQDRQLVMGIVEAVRDEIGDRFVHVLGIGHPELVADLYRAGVDSVDSSAYVKLAAEGRLWEAPEIRYPDPTSWERLQLALCNLANASGVRLPLSAVPTFRIAARVRSTASDGMPRSGAG
jgi:helicase